MSADDLDGQDLEAAFDAAFDDGDWATEAEGAEQVNVAPVAEEGLLGPPLSCPAGGDSQDHGPHGNPNDAPAASKSATEGAACQSDRRPRKGPKRPRAPPPCVLPHLPREILLRILAMVPATGLLAVAKTCRTLQQAAGEDLLWRRLFCARWGKPTRPRANTQWRRAYLDADSEEWTATLSRASGGNSLAYLVGCGAGGGGRGGGGRAGGRGGEGSSCSSEKGGRSGDERTSRCGSGGSRGGGGSGAKGVGREGERQHDEDDDAMVGPFLDMLRAKRGTALDRRRLDDLMPVEGDLAAQVAAWRKSRGFADPGPSAAAAGPPAHGAAPAAIPTGAEPTVSGSSAAAAGPSSATATTAAAAAVTAAAGAGGRAAVGASSAGSGGSVAVGPVGPTPGHQSLVHNTAPRPDLSKRGRSALTFTRVNPGQQPPVYACNETGWVHVCGDECTEGVVDADSELVVCPVSGQSTDRLVHECEYGYGGEDGRGAGGAAEEEMGGVFGGGFGSFFVAGYECENERALKRLLGGYTGKRM